MDYNKFSASSVLEDGQCDRELMWTNINNCFYDLSNIVKKQKKFTVDNFDCRDNFRNEYRKLTASHQEYKKFISLCHIFLKLDSKLSKKEDHVIDSEDSNALVDIINTHKKQSPVVINSLLPILGKKNFIEVILKNKIPFSSIEEPEISKAISSSLQHISSKKYGNPIAGENTVKQAVNFAKKIGPIINEIEKEGAKTLQAKANELNKRKIWTLRGKKWTPTAVKNTYQRWVLLHPKD